MSGRAQRRSCRRRVNRLDANSFTEHGIGDNLNVGARHAFGNARLKVVKSVPQAARRRDAARFALHQQISRALRAATKTGMREAVHIGRGWRHAAVVERVGKHWATQQQLIALNVRFDDHRSPP